MSAELRTVNLRGNRPAVFHARRAYFQMAPADRERLQGIVCDTQRTNSRSRCFALSRSLTIHDKEYLGIRCKGISPLFDQEGNLFPHRGSGFLPAPVEVAADGCAYVAPAYSTPQGTNTRSRVLNEFKVASVMGPDLADVPLGYGFYEGLSFEGEPVGYMVSAMKTPLCLRLLRDWVQVMVLGGKMAGLSAYRTLILNGREFSEAFFRFGRALADMHRLGFTHLAPHLNHAGIGENDQRDIWLRDLDAAKKLGQMTPEQRLGYLMLDLTKAMFSFCRKREIRVDGFAENYTLSNFLLSFISGYLGTEQNIDIGPEEVQMLRVPYDRVIDGWLKKKEVRFDIPAWASRHQAKGIRYIYRHLRRMVAD